MVSQKYFFFGFTLTFISSAVQSSEIGIRDYFQCESCATRTCPVIETPCELVREPGICACCFRCAKMEGEYCGLTRGRCSRGLRCRPEANDPDPILALMIGRGRCQRPRRRSYRNKLINESD